MSDQSAKSRLWRGRCVLVTGGTGFIGSHLIRRLLQVGAQVHGLKRSSSSTWRLADCTAAVRWHTVDVRDAEAVAQAVKEVKPTVVFHLAACGVEPQDRDPTVMNAVNVLGTLNLLQACQTVGLSLFVHVGSCFESLPRHHQEIASDEVAYAASKLAASGVCETFARAVQLPYVIVRPFTTYGPHESPHRLIPTLMRAVRQGEVPLLSNGGQVRDFIFVEDVVDGILHAATSLAAVGVAIELGTGQGASIRQVVETILRITGSPLKPHYGVLPKRSADALKMIANPNPALHLCDWRAQTTLVEGLTRTWKWFQDGAQRETHARQENASIEVPTEAPQRLKQEIFDKVRVYYHTVHRQPSFRPFEHKVPYAGRVFDEQELIYLTDSALDFWLTLGPYGEQLERRLTSWIGTKNVVLVNSGSSANLAAVATLLSAKVSRRLRPGDEVVTPAVTFPTSLAPLVQAGLVPVFVDCEVGTYNIHPELLEEAVSPRTKAILVPHTLGNPCDLARLVDVAQRHQLWLIEDCCDALGSSFDGRFVGTFGALATLSFYPAHHMTLGEGGAVVVNRPDLVKIVRSIRDWGRDCWCAPGQSNTCGIRFQWQLGKLPYGYDHKYIYSQIGYNLKPTDLQAAIGVAQLDKLPTFIERRRANFARLYQALEPYQDYLILPKSHPKAIPSWFGFPLTVQGGASRLELVTWLEEARIETRQIFAGNVLRQPAYRGIPHRVAGTLEQSDRVMRDAFFIGVYPGISDAMLEFVIERFQAFFDRMKNHKAVSLSVVRGGSDE